ncbi:MAG TPA: hypothetical protein VIK53_05855 [Verrucomicrobiae bacterium]
MKAEIAKINHACERAMNKVITNLILLSVCSFVIAGCADRVVEYQSDSSGHVHYVGTFTEEESWKQIVESTIDREKAGERPDGGFATWEQDWQNWYANIRRTQKMIFKSDDLKTPEDMVTYMKQRRIARGLPPYE